jgi:hypothetical protein
MTDTTHTDPAPALAGYCTDCDSRTVIREGRCSCGSGRVIADTTTPTPSGLDIDALRRRLIFIRDIEKSSERDDAAAWRVTSSQQSEAANEALCLLSDLLDELERARRARAEPPASPAHPPEGAALAERARIADALDHEAEVTPCDEDAKVVRDCAQLVRANFSYRAAERSAGGPQARPPDAEAARPSGEDDVILAMCRAHDREAAAQKGEPSPWDLEEARSDHDWVQERFFAMREAFDIAARALRAERVPTGYRLVPVEPTPDMIDAGTDEYWDTLHHKINVMSESPVGRYWRAMLDAAPEPPTPAEVGERAEDYERCSTCNGTGLALNMAGEPDECSECKGDTVVPREPPASPAEGEVADLVEVLHWHECGCGGECGTRTPAYIRKAAATLDRLTRRVAELEEACNHSESMAMGEAERAEAAQAQLDAALEVLERAADDLDQTVIAVQGLITSTNTTVSAVAIAAATIHERSVLLRDFIRRAKGGSDG